MKKSRVVFFFVIAAAPLTAAAVMLLDFWTGAAAFAAAAVFVLWWCIYWRGLVYKFGKRFIVITGGVFFRRKRFIPLDSILYRTNTEICLGKLHIPLICVLHTAGGRITLLCNFYDEIK